MGCGYTLLSTYSGRPAKRPINVTPSPRPSPPLLTRGPFCLLTVPATYITSPPTSPITHHPSPPPPRPRPQVPYKNLECLRDLNAVYDAVRVEDIYHAASHFDFSDASIFTCIGTSGRSQPPVPEKISPVSGTGGRYLR